MHAAAAKGAEQTSAGSGKLIAVLTLMLLTLIILSLLSFFHVYSRDAQDREYLLRAAELQALSQQIAKYGPAAAAGRDESFVRLRQARARGEELLAELKGGVPRQALPASPATVKKYLDVVEQDWQALRQAVDQILDARQSILSALEYARAVWEAATPLLQQADRLATVLASGSATAQQAALAGRQLMLVQRIHDSARLVLAGSRQGAGAIGQIAEDAAAFAQAIEALRQGDAARDIAPLQLQGHRSMLADINSLFLPLNDHVGQLHPNPALGNAQAAAGSLMTVSESLYEQASTLVEAYGQSPSRLVVSGFRIGPYTSIFLGALAALALCLLGVVLVGDAKRRERLSAQHYARNQHDIKRLLQEMEGLASGDLSVSLSDTQESTGAIAHAINHMVESLRALVVSINATTEQVLSSVQESQAVALHLADASEHQAEQMATASHAIGGMTQAIDQMAKDATASADVARQAVAIAGKGAATVRSTIEGMETTREQIQQTARRLKRLGESTQEIGDAVELIEDISDQTNILALNAAIQASTAGEAGRGFAVVADEVQRLAERTTQATKRIEALVRTIQVDTSEAISSMEVGASGVIGGEQLAQEAGKALREIETVSKQIAEVTGEIAASAQRQSVEAVQLNDTMRVIQEMSLQTADSSTQSACFIGTLAETADELQESVAGFRLPAPVGAGCETTAAVDPLKQSGLC